ncbi:MAG: hypothetical protein OXH04_16690 [Acidobacteria bacterium]|nr:hypothetical protein [Acidobacteriota bacterium]
MKKTWASGALELLQHAYSHMEGKTAFDKRMAFISIDNCVEVSIRSFLALPKAKSGISVPRSERDGAGGSFPKLLDLVAKHAPGRLVGLDSADVEHYHRIRNQLYHDGTGLSVDDEYLHAYRGIAEVLIENLFGVTVTVTAPAAPVRQSLEALIHSWNRIERLISAALERHGFSSTFKWEEAFAADLLRPADVAMLTELRIARNRLVHSETVEAADIAYWVERSSRVLEDLERRLGDRRRRPSGQRRAWIEMNHGEDVRGSRPHDDDARTIATRLGGVPIALGYRFPDGSVLQVRQGRVVASPDPPEWEDRTEGAPNAPS